MHPSFSPFLWWICLGYLIVAGLGLSLSDAANVRLSPENTKRGLRILRKFLLKPYWDWNLLKLFLHDHFVLKRYSCCFLKLWKDLQIDLILGNPLLKCLLVGGWTNPFEKYAQVKLDHLPRDRVENKKYLKPPPSLSLKSLVLVSWRWFLSCWQSGWLCKWACTTGLPWPKRTKSVQFPMEGWWPCTTALTNGCTTYVLPETEGRLCSNLIDIRHYDLKKSEMCGFFCCKRHLPQLVWPFGGGSIHLSLGTGRRGVSAHLCGGSWKT